MKRMELSVGLAFILGVVLGLLFSLGVASAQLKGPDQRGTGRAVLARPSIYYSASPGPPLYACNASTARRYECVSDATMCLAGTTYASGGSTLCQVQCNNAGTLWKETGVACQ